jgi:peptide/nickel transport system permease protein
MYRYTFRRAVTSVFVLFGVSVVTYLMMYLTPGDPAELVLRAQTVHDQAAVEQFREQYRLDEPVWIQYGHWLWDVLHGDFGRSYVTNRPVSAMLVDNAPSTAILAVAAMAIALAIAVPAGVVSAVHKGQVPDSVSQLGSLLGVSMPNFWLGYILILVFSIGMPVRSLGVFPVSGAGSLDRLVLPALTLGSGVAAIMTRLLRSAMLEVLEEDYVRTARSKGLAERVVVYKHAFRNALIPVITVAGIQFGYLLNGAVVVEIVFARPGLGKLVIDALFDRDYPVIQAATLVIAAMFVGINFLVDVTYRYIDPRIDLERGRR